MNYTGILYDIVVYNDNGIPIGSGYRVFYYKGANGDIRESHTLVDLENNELSNGFYTLRQTDDGKLVVINRTVQ